jgi:hypothetical protein
MNRARSRSACRCGTAHHCKRRARGARTRHQRLRPGRDDFEHCGACHAPTALRRGRQREYRAVPKILIQQGGDRGSAALGVPLGAPSPKTPAPTPAGEGLRGLPRPVRSASRSSRHSSGRRTNDRRARRSAEQHAPALIVMALHGVRSIPRISGHAPTSNPVGIAPIFPRIFGNRAEAPRPVGTRPNG